MPLDHRQKNLAQEFSLDIIKIKQGMPLLSDVLFDVCEDINDTVVYKKHADGRPIVVDLDSMLVPNIVVPKNLPQPFMHSFFVFIAYGRFPEILILQRKVEVPGSIETIK